MKKTVIYILLSILGALQFACQKLSVSEPVFDVKTSGTTFKVGDVITFTFSANPDYISFYSGETGHQYVNRNRSLEHGTAQTFKFTSLVSAGTQANNLKLMVSTDFDGIYAAADIANATWTDITSRATLSAGTSLASGSVDLTDIAALAKPCYLGFYYYSPQNTTKPSTWTISAPTVTNTLADGTVSTGIANFANTGFVETDLQNSAKKWVINTTSMAMAGGNVGDPINEDWAISTAINLNAVAAPDYGVGIKSVDALLPSYTYTYTKAGTYTVTFVASNTNVDNSKSVVKEMTITITP